MVEIFYDHSYIFTAFFLILIILLLWLRYRFKNINEIQDFSIGNDQIIGKREEQQDSFSTVINENGVIAVLADGMGGYSKGKLASSVAVKILIKECLKLGGNIYPLKSFLMDVCYLANKEVLESSKGIRTGTTAAVAIIFEDYLYWASIGDCAIILFRKGEFINLNKKHTFEKILEERYHSGEISKQQLINNPMKKRITSYIGYEGLKSSDIETHEIATELLMGDKLILCSDGVYNSISELEMEKVLAKNMEPYKAAEEIINIIKSKNYLKQDNATIVIVEKNN